MEHFAKMARGPVGEGFEAGQRFPIGNFPFETCNRAVRDAAGIDERKVAQIGGHVEGKTVRSHAASNMNSDGGDFALSLRADLWLSSPQLSSKGLPHRRWHHTPVNPQMRPA